MGTGLKPKLHFFNQPDRMDENGKWIRSWYDSSKSTRMQYHTRSGSLYEAINKRCLIGGYEQGKNPTYTGCSNGFPDYQEFCDWCQDQFGYWNKEENGTFWRLDKDIIKLGNKLYSPDLCCFVPHRINCLLVSANASRGDLPLGVYRKKGKYAACMRAYKTINLGSYDDVMSAHRAWQKAKSDCLRNAALELPIGAERAIEGLIRIADQISFEMSQGLETIRA